MSKSNKHEVEFGGKTFKRASEGRVYTHVVCGVRAAYTNWKGEVEPAIPCALAWASSLGLAIKASAQHAKHYANVVVLPVAKFTPRSPRSPRKCGTCRVIEALPRALQCERCERLAKLSIELEIARERADAHYQNCPTR